MKNILCLTIFFLIIGCSKTKTVLICGDHICVNKNEAEQYFEDNLSLEVRIVDKKDENKIDLVELNLKSTENEVKTVSITEKKDTNENIRILSNVEIKKKKAELKEKKRISKLKKTKIEKEKIKKIKVKKEKKKNLLKLKKKKINKKNRL